MLKISDAEDKENVKIQRQMYPKFMTYWFFSFTLKIKKIKIVKNYLAISEWTQYLSLSSY